MQIKITVAEAYQITSALEIAKATFKHDSKVLRDAGQVRLAEQFERQALEAQSLIEKLEGTPDE